MRVLTRISKTTLFSAACTYGNSVNAGLVTEKFDTDPGWRAYGIPVNDSDLGYRVSSFAGGDRVEAVGIFSATDKEV
jgi:hypothetical protein